MKKVILLLALTAPFSLAGCAHRTTVVVQEPPPPVDFGAIGQRGFHDGFNAGRSDIANNRPPNLEQHPRFRNPPVPPAGWEDYRHGFREGYNRAQRPNG